MNELIEPEEEPNKQMEVGERKVWFCYLLISDDGATYVGATVNPDRRLRQHNGLLVGGAKATSRKPGMWKRMCYVKGFPDNHAALQFEWRWKSLSRKKISDRMEPLERRLEALKELMALDRPTSKAVPYSLYPEPLEVVYE